MEAKKARQALEAVALQHGVPIETVIREIEQTIRTAMSSPDAAIQARWAEIPRSGDIPTPEELVAYLAAKMLR